MPFFNHRDFPSTFRGAHGRISYVLIFGIHRRWRFEKNFSSELKFERLVNIGGPQYLRPLSLSDSTIVCCCLGEISMDAQLERKGFIPGETIRITAGVANGTSLRIVPKAELVKRETYRARSYRCVSKTLNCTKGQPVRPHASHVCCELSLPIPGDVYTSLENCAILDIQYVVVVSLRAIGCSKLRLLFPIVIGSARVPVPEPYGLPPRLICF
ncbi:arrestin domain-containing protein 2-like isoform X2 [Engraulis encrasicolus]|uniref:arrestin domain-containing protein 2-like isoform X2 n=1 Tax=Engraulis encrasicolus TaxID=184585 RepID=UPI002FD74F69